MDKEASWVGEEQKMWPRQITGQIPPRESLGAEQARRRNRWVGRYTEGNAFIMQGHRGRKMECEMDGKAYSRGLEQASTMSKFPLRKGSVCGSFTGQATSACRNLANDLFYEQWEGAVVVQEGGASIPWYIARLSRPFVVRSA